MEKKDEFDACMQIVTMTIDRRSNRDNYEWKFTIAFWTLLAAAISSRSTLGTLTDEPALRAGVGTLVYLAYVVFWLRGVHDGHHRDKKRGKHYLGQAETLLKACRVVPPKAKKQIPELEHWGATFQALITLVLIGLFIIG